MQTANPYMITNMDILLNQNKFNDYDEL